MEVIRVRGASIPALGFGTWELAGESCRTAVEDALELGYRHIDTAQIYDNESEVGAALAASSVAREDIFLTTKVWREKLAPTAVRSSTEASLGRLQTDYVDLLLIHWPNEAVPLEDTLEAMAELQDEGKVRHLGVSNFPTDLVNRALDTTSIVCNQVEYHPLLAQQAVLQNARTRELCLTAYSPLARGEVMNEQVLVDIGKRHGKSPAQVTLRWLIDHGMVAAIPKASSREHAGQNLEVFDFELSPPEQATIAELARGERIISPSWAPEWDER